MLACAPVRWLSGALPLLCAAGCASAHPRGVPARAGATPAPARESLHVSAQSPGPTDVIQARDSTFLFGAVRGGVGRESLTVGGTPVPLLANGAWIAWVPLPDDTIAAFRLVARSGGDSVVQDVTARIAPRYRPPPRAAFSAGAGPAPSERSGYGWAGGGGGGGKVRSPPGGRPPCSGLAGMTRRACSFRRTRPSG